MTPIGGSDGLNVGHSGRIPDIFSDSLVPHNMAVEGASGGLIHVAIGEPPPSSSDVRLVIRCPKGPAHSTCRWLGQRGGPPDIGAYEPHRKSPLDTMRLPRKRRFIPKRPGLDDWESARDPATVLVWRPEKAPLPSTSVRRSARQEPGTPDGYRLQIGTPSRLRHCIATPNVRPRTLLNGVTPMSCTHLIAFRTGSTVMTDKLFATARVSG